MDGNKSELISVQSNQFWSIVSSCLEKAFPLYKEHPGPPLSTTLNIQAAAAITLLVMTLESHVNRLLFFKQSAITTDYTLLDKVEAYLPNPRHATLRAHLAEVTVCRDAITHALVWEETREIDGQGTIIRQEWRIAPITKLRQKLKKHVDLLAQPPVTRTLGMNVVPTLVGFIDAINVLLVVCRVMRALEREHGNPAAWVGPIPVEVKMQKTFPIEPVRDEPEAWVEAVLRELHPADLNDLTRRFGIDAVRVDGTLAFVGIGGVHDHE